MQQNVSRPEVKGKLGLLKNLKEPSRWEDWVSGEVKLRGGADNTNRALPCEKPHEDQ